MWSVLGYNCFFLHKGRRKSRQRFRQSEGKGNFQVGESRASGTNSFLIIAFLIFPGSIYMCHNWWSKSFKVLWNLMIFYVFILWCGTKPCSLSVSRFTKVILQENHSKTVFISSFQWVVSTGIWNQGQLLMDVWEQQRLFTVQQFWNIWQLRCVSKCLVNLHTL